MPSEKNISKILNHLVAWAKTLLEMTKKDGAVIGVSGGVDSATTLKLLEQCLSKNKILPLILPDQDSNPKCIRLAEKVCKDYNFKKISITPILQKLNIYRDFQNYFIIPRRIKEKYVQKRFKQFGDKLYLRFLKGDLDAELQNALGYIRIKNRIRMAIMYHHAETRNYAVIGTVNKTEYLLGFFVPFGDGVADIMPFIHLYKTNVYEIARALDVPDEIITRAPSPDLIPGLTDETILGMGYEEIDEILKMLVKNKKRLSKTEEVRYIAELYKWAKKLRTMFFPIQTR